MNKLLILTSNVKFDLNSLIHNDVPMKLLITIVFGCHDKVKVRNELIFKQWSCRD